MILRVKEVYEEVIASAVARDYLLGDRMGGLVPPRSE